MASRARSTCGARLELRRCRRAWVRILHKATLVDQASLQLAFVRGLARVTFAFRRRFTCVRLVHVQDLLVDGSRVSAAVSAVFCSPRLHTTAAVHAYACPSAAWRRSNELRPVRFGQGLHTARPAWPVCERAVHMRCCQGSSSHSSWRAWPGPPPPPQPRAATTSSRCDASPADGMHATGT